MNNNSCAIPEDWMPPPFLTFPPPYRHTPRHGDPFRGGEKEGGRGARIDGILLLPDRFIMKA